MKEETDQEFQDMFGPIVELRKLLTESLNLWKLYWKEVPTWSFKITEYEITEDFGVQYFVEVWVGINHNLCLFRESCIMGKKDEFAVKAYARLDAWKRMFRNMIIAGNSKIYNDTILRHRDGRMSPRETSAAQYPLTPNEVIEIKYVSK